MRWPGFISRARRTGEEEVRSGEFGVRSFFGGVRMVTGVTRGMGLR